MNKLSIETTKYNVSFKPDYPDNKASAEESQEHFFKKMNEVHPPIELVMKYVDYCYICDKNPVNVNSLNFGRLYGWLYCDDCTSIVKSSAISFINNGKNIPLHWLLRSNKFNKKNKLINTINNESTLDDNDTVLDFFRYSKKDTPYEIQEAVLKHYDMDPYEYGCYMIIKNNDAEYCIFLLFHDVESNARVGRFVSLKNIFAHNDDFYHELINCEDLFCHSDIKIGFNDLSIELKNEIHETYNLAKSSDKRSFLK